MKANFELSENKINATFSISIIPDISNLATKAELQAVSESIPTDTSDLKNSAGFITTDVDDLKNYYTSATIDLYLENKQNALERSESIIVDKNSVLVDTEWLEQFIEKNYDIKPKK